MGETLYSILDGCLSASYAYPFSGAGYSFKKAGSRLYLFFDIKPLSCDGSSASASSSPLSYFSPLKLASRVFPPRAYSKMKNPWRCNREICHEWKTLIPFIADHINALYVKSVTVAGFGGGGALAFLCYEYIYFNKPELRGTIRGFAFGSPKIFYGRLNGALRLKWTNFVNVINHGDKNAKKPSLPFFKRPGKLIQIGESGRYDKSAAQLPKVYLKELLFI